MTISRTLVTVMLLLAGSLPALAQSAEAQFQELRVSLNRALEREKELVREMEFVGERARTAPAGTVAGSVNEAPVFPAASPVFARLRQLLPVMRAIFDLEGVPRELMLVGLVESGYRPDAVSRANAVGIWQFIPATARRFGLMTDTEDQRADVIRSTRAAAQYLRMLLDQFGNWELALAAYNAGEDRVEDAIRAARSRDFQRIAELKLVPAETRNYVPAVLHAIAEARNLGILAARQIGESNE